MCLTYATACVKIPNPSEGDSRCSAFPVWHFGEVFVSISYSERPLLIFLCRGCLVFVCFVFCNLKSLVTFYVFETEAWVRIFYSDWFGFVFLCFWRAPCIYCPLPMSACPRGQLSHPHHFAATQKCGQDAPSCPARFQTPSFCHGSPFPAPPGPRPVRGISPARAGPFLSTSDSISILPPQAPGADAPVSMANTRCHAVSCMCSGAHTQNSL